MSLDYPIKGHTWHVMLPNEKGHELRRIYPKARRGDFGFMVMNDSFLRLVGNMSKMGLS